MTAASVQLIRPTAADIPFIMATERIEGYELLLGRSDEVWHRAALGDARFAYFIGKLGGEAIGFTILRDWGAPERVTHIKRFAVVRPGQGLGKPLLRAVMDAVFAQTSAYRLSLGLFPENARARRVYENSGFQVEGVSRGSAYFNGVNRDELVMSILRPEWAQMRAADNSRIAR
ncbi:GNAT family N-acetyltransferase [Methylocapsa sp. S129]|uniref:GNAT family N-acetyltransferase n=1 Tax=Methylocapsa sp. S129 TaxID=1641869 RepID=UPI001FEE0567|nr:GNAT family protein [Methylocapsa sp. S129]